MIFSNEKTYCFCRYIDYGTLFWEVFAEYEDGDLSPTNEEFKNKKMLGYLKRILNTLKNTPGKYSKHTIEEFEEFLNEYITTIKDYNQFKQKRLSKKHHHSRRATRKRFQREKGEDVEKFEDEDDSYVAPGFKRLKKERDELYWGLDSAIDVIIDMDESQQVCVSEYCRNRTMNDGSDKLDQCSDCNCYKHEWCRKRDLERYKAHDEHNGFDNTRRGKCGC